MNTTISQTNKTNSRNNEQDEMERQLKGRALVAKIHRHLRFGNHLVQMRNPDTGEYDTLVKAELSDDQLQLIGYRSGDELPWNALWGDHVMIGGDVFRLNPKPTTKVIDPCMKLVDLTNALNSMTSPPIGSVFVAGSRSDSDEVLLVRHFLTDGEFLYAIDRHDNICHDLAGGWVFDLRYRRFVYGEGGPLQDSAR